MLFRGKSIADVLDMTVDEGADFFRAVPSIRDKMTTLQRVGLGYIHVGQPATTLSGGEAQRVKLSKELSRRATGRTLYILDEPTTGLHFEDVKKLLEVLHALVAAGNTVLLVNSTSAGMGANPPLDIDLSPLPKSAAVCDIVYNPLETKLLKDAAGRGHKTIDGLGMLMHQAAPSFEAFFGVRPKVTPALREALVKVLSAR